MDFEPPRSPLFQIRSQDVGSLFIFSEMSVFRQKKAKNVIFNQLFFMKKTFKNFFFQNNKIKLKITQKKNLGFFLSKLAEISAFN